MAHESVTHAAGLTEAELAGGSLTVTSPIDGLADDVDLGFVREQRAQSLPHDSVVVDQEHSRRHRDLPCCPATGSKGATSVTRRTTRVTRMREASEARKAASPVFVAVMILTTLAMLYGVIVVPCSAVVAYLFRRAAAEEEAGAP